MTSSQQLSVAEELVLLCWHDEKGKPVHTSTFRMLLAGALVIDLALAELVSVDDGALVAADGASASDALHADLLDRIRRDDKPRKVSKWMHRWSSDKALRQAVFERLVQRGVLRAEEQRVLGLFAVTRHPVADLELAQSVRQRVGAVLVAEEDPTPRDAAIAGLAATAGAPLVKQLVDKPHRKDALKRGKRLAKEGVSADVADAVQQAQAAAMAAVTAAAAASAASSSSSSGS